MAVAIASIATIALPPSSVAQNPKIGGGYKNSIAIEVDDPQTKAIAGALFKPAGVGPFPAVISMSTCAGLNSGEEIFVQAALRDRLLAKGFAVLIVDPYWPRQEWQGVCEKPNAGAGYDARGAADIYAALDALKAMPEIDAKRIFVHGVGLGASAALTAIDAVKAAAHKTKLAGAIAVSPHCKEDAAPSAPALILIGDQDLWTPAVRCKALARAPNVEVKIYPGVGHAFTMPYGHRVQYNHEAAKDAEVRAEAFLDTRAIR
jgi:dienelactone hydrolase